jgi:hypothetical protein
MKRWTRLLIGAVAALTVGLGAGAAFAYFTNSGSGSGVENAGTLSPVTVVASAGTPGTPLLPGNNGDVVLSVHNPNPFSVTLVSVSANGTVTADGGHASCTPTGVSFVNQSALSVVIPANQTAFPVDLPNAASMSANAPNRCQGAIFSIPVSITVHVG